jgi:hypothetical protein
MKKFSGAGGPATTLAACVLIIAAINLACMGIKRPWRDYSPKPFSSTEWLAGDKIERGRMMTDMFRNRAIEGGTRETAVKTLGEPDLKKTIEKREVWFYRMDLGMSGAMDLIPISFDEKGRSSMGMVKGDTISIALKESEL